jgi:hypothetical protein
MAEETPITIPAIIAAMKEAGFVTQSALESQFGKLREEIKQDTDEAIHHQLTEFYAGHIEPKLQEMDERFQQQMEELKEGQKRLEEGQQRLENGQAWIKDDLEGLKEEFASTPTRGEVEELKTRMDRLERTN